MKSDYLAYIGIGLTCLCIFATCDGCDNEDYEDDATEYRQSSSGNESEVPSWMTKYKFVHESSSGANVVKLYSNGKAHLKMQLASGRDMDFDGTFHVSGNKVYLSLSGTTNSIVFTIDYDRHRLYSADGSTYKQSVL